jgi:DNA-binding SARP family transcriptional activator
VEFRILGPLEVAVEGTPVVLGPAKQRALLGILLLHANEVVPRERLVDELWGERPPPTATKIVQVYVSQLRRALDAHGGGDVLRTRAPGYVAAVEDEQLDARRFATLVAQARKHAEAEGMDQAAEAYADALALWRGPVLADLVLESHARINAERLAELRLEGLAE